MHMHIESAFDIKSCLDTISHWLPTQGPIRDFIHHNTLHAYQDRPFHEGVRTASRMYGSHSYLSLSEFLKLYRQGQISESSLAAAARGKASIDELKHGSWIPRPAGIFENGLRARWTTKHSINMDNRVHPTLFRIASNYLDQGVASWRMPHSSETLYDALRKIVEESFLPLPPFSHPEARRLLRKTPENAIAEILKRFLGSEKHFERYLTETCLAHAGWSGMIRVIEDDPSRLVMRRSPNLVDFIALELIAEYVVAYKTLGAGFAPIATPDEPKLSIPADEPLPPQSDTERLQEIWQEAMERSYVEPLLERLARHKPLSPTGTPFAQAFFCIDDRACSVRRHLEAVLPNVETFATAGFFGVDCNFQGISDSYAYKHCPVPVSPTRLIREIAVRPASAPNKTSWKERSLHLESASNTFLRGWLITQTLGFWSAVKLAVSLFRPSLEPATASSLRRLDTESKLQIDYTFDEMADRIENVLKSTGAAKSGLSDLVVLIGHGASSVNNPYFAAYDCGACSGKPGSPNARAFAVMANNPTVRRLLGERGLRIRENTWFVGGIHDTTRDELQYYDLDLLPEGLRKSFESFKAGLEQALEKNAQERCQMFEMVPKDIDTKRALAEVRRRSVAIFEPRPEFNHATNACAIVGRRALTRGLDLKRRAFLNSYDPSTDPEGSILSSILSAVVPVCGGISLEYYFSRVDVDRYGAGSKLPHNVNGLIGVTNGVEGDLLTGLPTQMIEVHTPVRLNLIVEHEADVALAAAKKNASIFEWIENYWIRYFSISPSTKKIREFRDGKMVEWQ